MGPTGKDAKRRITRLLDLLARFISCYLVGCYVTGLVISVPYAGWLIPLMALWITALVVYPLLVIIVPASALVLLLLKRFRCKKRRWFALGGALVGVVASLVVMFLVPLIRDEYGALHLMLSALLGGGAGGFFWNPRRNANGTKNPVI